MARMCSFCLWAGVPRSCDNCEYKPEAPVRSYKPPLGIQPRHIREELRLRALREVIARYMQACMPIDPEWVAEYNELVAKKRQQLSRMRRASEDDGK